jgi:hypothetical protein
VEGSEGALPASTARISAPCAAHSIVTLVHSADSDTRPVRCDHCRRVLAKLAYGGTKLRILGARQLGDSRSPPGGLLPSGRRIDGIEGFKIVNQRPHIIDNALPRPGPTAWRRARQYAEYLDRHGSPPPLDADQLAAERAWVADHVTFVCHAKCHNRHGRQRTYQPRLVQLEAALLRALAAGHDAVWLPSDLRP